MIDATSMPSPEVSSVTTSDGFRLDDALRNWPLTLLRKDQQGPVDERPTPGGPAVTRSVPYEPPPFRLAL